MKDPQTMISVFNPATWDEGKEAELDDALRATPAQRLAWLEEALKIGYAGKSRRICEAGHRGLQKGLRLR